jgi:hypothetical protein
VQGLDAALRALQQGSLTAVTNSGAAAADSERQAAQSDAAQAQQDQQQGGGGGGGGGASSYSTPGDSTAHCWPDQQADTAVDGAISRPSSSSCTMMKQQQSDGSCTQQEQVQQQQQQQQQTPQQHDGPDPPGLVVFHADQLPGSASLADDSAVLLLPRAAGVQTALQQVAAWQLRQGYISPEHAVRWCTWVLDCAAAAASAAAADAADAADAATKQSMHLHTCVGDATPSLARRLPLLASACCSTTPLLAAMVLCSL